MLLDSDRLNWSGALSASLVAIYGDRHWYRG